MTDETEPREESEEDVDAQMKELEENPPDKLEDFPGGKAKYRTMGGSEADSGYDEGATAKLGPSEVRHFEDGSVTVSGEEVDDPEEFKGEPIPGGPTDPDAPGLPGEPQKDDGEDEKDDGEDE